MKRFNFFLFCVIITCMVTGQEVKNELLELHVSPPQFMVQEEPYAPIKGNIYLFLHEHFICPHPDVFNYGTAVIQFTVTDGGNLCNFQVLNGVSKEIDNALIETLKKTDGMWLPGSNNGEYVPMQQEVSLAIKTGMSVYKAERLNFKVVGTKMFVKGNNLLYVKRAPRRALRKYNYAMRLLPKEQCLFVARGMCFYALGNEQAALNDWKRAKELGGINMKNSTITAYKNIQGDTDLVEMSGE